MKGLPFVKKAYLGHGELSLVAHTAIHFCSNSCTLEAAAETDENVIIISARRQPKARFDIDGKMRGQLTNKTNIERPKPRRIVTGTDRVADQWFVMGEQTLMRPETSLA